MLTLFLLYGIVVSVLLVAAFFIIYHILRYSLAEPLRYFGAALFGSVFFALLSINFLSFQALETTNNLPTLEISPLLENPALTPKQSNPW